MRVDINFIHEQPQRSRQHQVQNKRIRMVLNGDQGEADNPGSPWSTTEEDT